MMEIEQVIVTSWSSLTGSQCEYPCKGDQDRAAYANVLQVIAELVMQFRKWDEMYR